MMATAALFLPWLEVVAVTTAGKIMGKAIAARIFDKVWLDKLDVSITRWTIFDNDFLESRDLT